jgi:hypothetical protein
MAQPFEPAVYCPNCGYAIDPGRCPECGAVVAAGALLPEPTRVTLRRHLRSVLKITAALAFLVGALALYQLDWPAWLPNSVVLNFAYADWGRMDREIRRRHLNSSFTPTEVDALFKHAMSFEPVYPRRIPAETPMPLILRGTRAGPLKRILAPFGGESVCVCVHTATVDQQLRFEESLRETYYLSDLVELKFALPPLPPGEHIVEIDGTWEYQPVNAAGISAGMVKQPLRLQFSISAEARPITEFVREDWSPELAESIRTSSHCVVKLPDIGNNRLEITFLSPAANVAFVLFARASPTCEYEPFSEFTAYSARVCPRGASWSFGLELPDRFATHSTVDIQLRPCPAAALAAGFDSCFGGTFEWLNLPLPPRGAADRAAPSRIFRAGAEGSCGTADE